MTNNVKISFTIAILIVLSSNISLFIVFEKEKKYMWQMYGHAHEFYLNGCVLLFILFLSA